NDGVVDGYPGDYTREWATVHQLNGAWIRLTWASAATLSQIVLHDRPNLTDNVLAGTLQFSDGSSINVGQLPNDGTGLVISFSSRSVSWVQFNITNAVGQNIGLAEFEAYGALVSLQLLPNPVIGGSTSQGTVKAAGPAPAGGTPISLSSNNSAATVPSSVTIPAGAATPTFSATTQAVANSTSAVITATGPGGSAVSSTLVLTPNGQDIALNATVSVSSQNTSTGQLGIKAIDGVIDGYPGDFTKEWATVGELGLRSGSSAYAWIRLDWSYVTLSEVDLYDRPSLYEH